eukprot:5119725-Pyramimonas_sp.AAC.1
MRGRLATRQDFQAILGLGFRVFACLAKHCACENLLGNHCDFVDGHPYCEFDSGFYRAESAAPDNITRIRPGWLQRWDQHL